VAGCGSDQTSGETVQSRLNEMLATRYSAYKTANNLPDGAGALVYIQSRDGTWLATAGLPAGVNENYHYRVASVTKTFTAAAIMLLDQQGKLNIDDTVTATIPGKAIAYLPDSPNYVIPYKSQITIRQLLSHRAGVFDITNDPVPGSSNAVYAGKYYTQYVLTDLNEPDHQFTFDELAGVVAVNSLSYWVPGTDYHYSNTGFMLLAVIIERVSGKSYDRFIIDNFITPMGLNATSLPWNANERAIPSPYLKGYSNQGTGYFETTEDNMSANVAEGNIIGTPADMARWIKTLLSGNGPLTREQITRMTTAPAGTTQGYALGIQSYANIGMGHTGGHQGFMNLVVYNPQDDLTMVVVLPFIDFNKVSEQGTFLLDIGKEARRIAGYTQTWPNP
jgi:D-alanyl-D-alanine carboxypeptidase